MEKFKIDLIVRGH
jgi:serine/threonine-protein phosphatase PP1 catalytic subunit